MQLLFFLLFFFAFPRLCVRSLLPAAELPPAAAKPFRYSDARVPNYLPHAAWGTLGQDITQMQLPLPPDESHARMVVADGLRAELFASEPDISPPLAMTWDDRGRLFLAESVDYPNDGAAPQPGHDRIRIVEDSNGDGRADRFTVFADRLSIPTSIVFAGRGLLVAQAPEMLYLEDTDGDDRADVRRVLFSGWGTSDTHAGPSNLRRGLDNWIWGTVGYSGFDGVVGGQRRTFRQGIYRFRPDGSELEFLGSTSNNTWGLGFTEEGHIIASTANGQHSVQMLIPNRYYDQVLGWNAPQVKPIADHDRIQPITDRVRQVDWHGRFTAAAGSAVYTARRFPQRFWNRAVFVAEPTGHLVHQCFLEGSEAERCEFVARDGGNLLASDDEWTAPIAAEVGPDGAVWVIDWYNFIVQHNPTPIGYETGKGNAYATPLRDKQHGRVYRVVPRESPVKSPGGLGNQGADELVRALTDDNMFWRVAAQERLVSQSKRDAVPHLMSLANDLAADPLNLNVGAIHALWTLDGLAALDTSDSNITSLLAAAMRHPSTGVRKAAFDVVPGDNNGLSLVLESGGLGDRSLQVRLSALLALARMPQSADAGRAVWRMLLAESDPADRAILDGVTSAGARHCEGFLAEALSNAEPMGQAGTHDVLRQVAVHKGSLAEVTALQKWIAQLAEAQAETACVVLEGLEAGWPEPSHGRSVALSADDLTRLRVVFQSLTLPAQVALVRLLNRWEHSDALAAERRLVAKRLAEQLSTPEASIENRCLAAEQLAVLDGSSTAAQSLVEQLDARLAPDDFQSMARAIRRSRAPQLGQLATERWQQWTPAQRRVVVSLLLTRPGWTEALVEALEENRITLADLDVEQRARLAGYPAPEIVQRIRVITEANSAIETDRQRIIENFLPLCDVKGDSVRGREVFVRECAKCHEQREKVPRIGPDLAGFAAHPKRLVLAEVLDPNRSVEGNFRQYTALLDDGRVLTGILAGESESAIELIDSQAERHVLRRTNLESIMASANSLMPEGFEKLPRQDLVDLLEYLNHGGRFAPLPLETVATVASDRGMFHDESSLEERLVFPDWKPKAVRDVPFQLIDPRGGTRPNVILLHSPQGTIPPRMPRSVSVPCGIAARAVHFLSGVSGWGHPLGTPDSVSLIVRFHYAGGESEDHVLRNGRHFADYIRRVDVPESKLAFLLGPQQVRYFALEPRRDAVIERIELIKGPDQTAPIVMGITAEESRVESRESRAGRVKSQESEDEPRPLGSVRQESRAGTVKVRVPDSRGALACGGSRSASGHPREGRRWRGRIPSGCGAANLRRIRSCLTSVRLLERGPS